MRYGINLPNFGAHTTPETLSGWARTTEDLGFHILTVSDHIALTPDAHRRSPAPFYEAFTTLTWLAAHTSTVELATGVVIGPQRHPVQLARIATTLDQLSQGRLVLGVGVGWARQGFDALGLPFHRRGAMTDEVLAALRTLFTEEIASFHGEFFHFDAVRTAPLPARRPHPPIWVGGSSPGALRRAALHADAWFPLWPRGPELAPALRVLADTAAAAGRRVPDFCPTIPLALTQRPVPRGRRLLGQGTLEQLHEDLSLLAKLGARYTVLNVDVGDARLRRPAEDDWELLRLLTEKVIDTRGEGLR
ncbi:TIGR03619 family F420-dependent LLM class oxidoreductase [Streptomyces sp. PT12]|uniref:TIGR03619 family F420-dependent LLM class oxidoreductase n=1 Tax=Streptomyces sp. PT12 TaxID=1510197 RepID=UPI000DE21285|nr:TIGR03619 family F420-dependent LLM class oxidoreductase [Streptomyces sp. PT12]RBM06245.1 LLM class F420-dependent oxidoreductase [Streptomyces sp. PT12]